MKPPSSSGSSQKLADLPPTVAEEVAVHQLPGDTGCLDVDRFADTLAAIKSTSVLRPDLIASIISRYAPMFLPELSAASPEEDSTATWLKKRRAVETLVELLPPERDAAPCGFVLRLLREACLAGASAEAMVELEGRAAEMLDRATLQDVMIPAFSHTCGTLLDVGLMLRLVRGFVAGNYGAARSTGAAMLRAAKLVDAYLAEAAVDASMSLDDFKELSRALPAHARANDDGLYRAVDTYIKAHPSSTKQQRKALWGLINTSKLSSEAALHAAQNERLPIRAAIQVLASEQARLSRGGERASGSFGGPQSPAIGAAVFDDGIGPRRVPSKREVASSEVRRRLDDVGRLQLPCRAMQAQIDRLGSERRKKSCVCFRWSSLLFGGGCSSDIIEKVEMRRPTLDVNQDRVTLPNKC